MAAGDFKIMRNASNTDTIPNAGSDLLLLWDTAVANEGTGITESGGTFTLGETGLFLVMCSDFEDVAAQTNNERINTKMTFTLAGTELIEGYSTGYIRKNNFGSENYCLFSAAIIDVTTTTGNGDDLQVRKERIDNTVGVGEESSRVGNNRSGVHILKLDDDHNFARYESTSTITTSATDNVRTVMDIGTTNEQASPFTRTGNVVDIATNNMVLAVYSVRSEAAAPTGRSEFQADIQKAGTTVPGSWTQQYIRTTDNTDWGGASCVVLLEPTSGQDIDLGVTSREGGGETFDGALQLWELPSGAETCIVEATNGNYNVLATDFAWDTNPQIDTDAFTHTTTQANVDVDNDGDYLAAVSMADQTDAGTTATRAVTCIQFRINTTDLETMGNSEYTRANGTADHNAVSMAGILPALSADDSIITRADRIGTNATAIACSSGAMSVIRMSSVFPAIVEGTVRPVIRGQAVKRASSY